MPHNVGIINDSSVHLKLFVSLNTVIQVVAHGKCINVKIIIHIAVVAVQPFAANIS